MIAGSADGQLRLEFHHSICAQAFLQSFVPPALMRRPDRGVAQVPDGGPLSHGMG